MAFPAPGTTVGEKHTMPDGRVFEWDGSSWVLIEGPGGGNGGVGNAAGDDREIQFNDDGELGASERLKFIEGDPNFGNHLHCDGQLVISSRVQVQSLADPVNYPTNHGMWYPTWRAYYRKASETANDEMMFGEFMGDSSWGLQASRVDADGQYGDSYPYLYMKRYDRSNSNSSRTQNGFVGIWNADPEYPLDVGGDLRLRPNYSPWMGANPTRPTANLIMDSYSDGSYLRSGSISGPTAIYMNNYPYLEGGYSWPQYAEISGPTRIYMYNYYDNPGVYDQFAEMYGCVRFYMYNFPDQNQFSEIFNINRLQMDNYPDRGRYAEISSVCEIYMNSYDYRPASIYSIHNLYFSNWAEGSQGRANIYPTDNMWWWGPIRMVHSGFSGNPSFTLQMDSNDPSWNRFQIYYDGSPYGVGPGYRLVSPNGVALVTDGRVGFSAASSFRFRKTDSAGFWEADLDIFNSTWQMGNFPDYYFDGRLWEFNSGWSGNTGFIWRGGASFFEHPVYIRSSTSWGTWQLRAQDSNFQIRSMEMSPNAQGQVIVNMALYTGDFTVNFALILNGLPSTAVAGTNRVWRDGSGYLRIG